MVANFTFSSRFPPDPQSFPCVQSAIKQSTAASQKHKNDYLIRALKCYALAMSGKKEEASVVRTESMVIPDSP